MTAQRFDFELLTGNIPAALYEAMAALHADRTACGFNVANAEHVIIIGMAQDVRERTGAGLLSNERRGDFYELTKLGAAYVIWRQRRVTA